MFNHVRFLIDKFGGPDGVVGAMDAFGVRHPPRDTIRKWFERGGVPGTWLPVLLCVLELEHGAPVRLAGYLEGKA